MRGMYTCRAAGPKLIPRRAGRPEKERRKGEGRNERRGKSKEGMNTAKLDCVAHLFEMGEK